MYPFEHKERALIALRGNWGNAVLVTFLAALMGGLVTATGGSFNLNLDERDLAALPDFVIPLLTLVLSLAAGGGLVQFILGGPVRLGYSRYLLKLHDGAPAEVGSLFSQFHNFGKGFVLNLLTNRSTHALTYPDLACAWPEKKVEPPKAPEPVVEKKEITPLTPQEARKAYADYLRSLFK